MFDFPWVRSTLLREFGATEGSRCVPVDDAVHRAAVREIAAETPDGP